MAILGVGSSLCWLVVVKPVVTIEFAGCLPGKLVVYGVPRGCGFSFF